MAICTEASPTADAVTVSPNAWSRGFRRHRLRRPQGAGRHERRRRDVPDDGNDSATLLRNADAALYRAKAEGRGAVRFFEARNGLACCTIAARCRPTLRSRCRVTNCSSITSRRRLIERQVIGFEALLRWDHPRRGFVPPGTLHSARRGKRPDRQHRRMGAARGLPRGGVLAQAAADRDQSLARPASAGRSRRAGSFGAARDRAFARPPGDRDHRRRADGRLIRARSRCCAGSRRSACRSRWTISAPAIRRSPICSRSRSTRSRSTRPSSPISTATRSPPRSCVRCWGSERASRSSTVAEGVENAQQLAILRREGCDEMQGYLIGRPQPISDYAELIGRSGKDKRLTAGA